jgi:DNA-binding PadR family transcriptional regulator
LITEQGIKSSLDCDLSLVSRLLKKNEKKGYLSRELMKVENKKRKQNAFFLTEKGEKVALEIKESKAKSLKKSKKNVTQQHLSEY